MASTHRTNLHRAAAALLAAVLSVGPLTLGAGPAAADPGDEVTISMMGLHFEQSVSEITTGTTLIFKNDEIFDYPALDGTHRIVSKDRDWDSGDIAPQAAWSIDILSPGDLSFYCSIHPTLMTGELSVTGDEITPEPTRRNVKIVEPSPSDTQSWGYAPDDILVDAGTTITWRNEGAQIHTVTAEDGSFDSGNMQPGESFTFTFDSPIALRYTCTPHPWMSGLVRVAGKGGAAPPPPAPPAGGSGGGSGVDLPTQQPARSGDGPATLDVAAFEGDLADPDSWGFAPPELTARVGDTIVWTNSGSIVHTATDDAGGFDSGDLEAGETFSLTLEDTGTISYACTPHPWMTGSIIVQAAGAPLTPQSPGQPGPPAPGEGSGEQPGAEEPGTDAPAQIDGSRVAFAGAFSGAVLLLGMLLMVPPLLARRRVRTPPPPPAPPVRVDQPEAEQRELVGAGR